MNEFLQGRGSPSYPDLLVVGVRVMLGHLRGIDELARDLRYDDDPEGGCGDRPVQRRQVAARNWQTSLPAFRGPAASLRLFLGALPRLRSLPALLGLGSLRGFLNGLPSMLEIFV